MELVCTDPGPSNLERSINGEATQSTVPVDYIKKSSLHDYIRSKLTDTTPGREDDEPFFVVDLGRLIELHRDWVAALPTVTPFYAVKCNEDPALLKTLAALGIGFDCASKIEIKTILDLGVSPDRIIYAQPFKQVSHLRYAVSRGVDLMTFDNDAELHSIHEHCPTARLVLRIRVHERPLLGAKYGCTIPGGKLLLDTAKSLGLNVVGISFHVGTKAQSPSVYENALKMAAELFVYGSQIGYQFTLLDIGGGFPGYKKFKEIFHRVASAINSTLETLFSPDTYPGLRVIAEPGRFFACSTHTLVLKIISKSLRDKEEGKQFMYYVNDGIYGSFMFFTLDHSTPMPSFLKECSGPLHSSVLWGPTCAIYDHLGETLLPELEVGDWMCYADMGAYTRSSATTFNGFPKNKSFHYVTSDNQKEFCELFPQLSPLMHP